MRTPTINLARPINWDHPLNKGLVSMWSAIPSWNNGTIWKDLANKNHGTLTNMVQGSTSGWSRNAAIGQYGSMLFDGTTVGQSIKVPDALGLRLQVCTMIASFRLTSVSVFNPIFSKARATANTPSYEMGVSSSAKLYIYNGSTVVSGSTGLSANVNYTAAWIQDNGTARFYLNGVADGTASQTASSTFDTNALFLGNDFDSSRSGDGTPVGGILNRIIIKNKVDSPAEINSGFELSKKFDVGILNYLSSAAYSYPSSGVVSSSGLLLRRRRMAAA